jgi:predicted nuclease of predicted toxin-antitoxin system
MNFLCDVHIPIALVKFLSDHGCEASHVNSLPKKWNSTDSEICQFADKTTLF